MSVQIRLTTTGRNSGRAHEVTLYAWPDEERLVVVGSYGGSPEHPDWVSNLRANPTVVARRGREEVGYTAQEVEGPERDRLWAMVTAEFPLYRTYQERTDRIIPLFTLEPTA